MESCRPGEAIVPSMNQGYPWDLWWHINCLLNTPLRLNMNASEYNERQQWPSLMTCNSVRAIHQSGCRAQLWLMFCKSHLLDIPGCNGCHRQRYGPWLTISVTNLPSKVQQNPETRAQSLVKKTTQLNCRNNGTEAQETSIPILLVEFKM